MMVLQWGQWRLQGLDWVFYDFFYEEVFIQFVINGVFYWLDQVEIVEFGFGWVSEIDLDYLVFDEFYCFEKDY